MEDLETAVKKLRDIAEERSRSLSARNLDLNCTTRDVFLDAVAEFAEAVLSALPSKDAQ